MSTLGNNLLAEYYAQQNFGPRSNEVWYYADAQVTLYSQTNVVSHTFENGKGVITFANTLTVMPNVLRETLITNCIIPKSITKINNYVFDKCYNLNMQLHDAITEIGVASYRGCSDLSLSHLPNKLETLNDACFRNCTSININTIPATVKTISSNIFFNNALITSITFLATPISIYNNAFNAMISLTTIRVPWSEGEVANAPWGATNATIIYNYQL